MATTLEAATTQSVERQTGHRELDAYHQDPDKIDRSIVVASDDSPDAPVKRMEVGSERFEACEGLFKPELWGLDQAGVHVLVHKAIK